MIIPISTTDGRRRRSRNFAAATSVSAMLLLMSACGDGDFGADATPPPAAADEALVVTAVDYGYIGLPERIDSGTMLTLQNDSDEEVHELVAIRLPDGETRSVADLMKLPPKELAALFPLVETVVVAPPGEAGFAVEGTGTLTEPGRYAVICVIPTGADPATYLAAAAEAEGGPPEVAGGPPHIANGMFAELTVEG